MVKVYISGPISGLPELTFAEKKKRFYNAETQFREAGIEVVNSFRVMACAEENCAPDNTDREGDFLHDWTCYLKYDLIAMLRYCNTVALLPGWTQSKGALLEVGTALDLKYNFIALDPHGASLGSVAPLEVRRSLGKAR